MSAESHLSWAETSQNGQHLDLANAIMYRSELLRQSGAPVLYSLKHLAITTGVDYGYLRRVVLRDARAYKAIRIRKNTGGFRDLLSPSETLKEVQRWILHEILELIPKQINNFAYFKNSTTKHCAIRHAGALWMIKADIHNYFPSISEKHVYKVFQKLGYSDLLSYELSRLCTWDRTAAPQSVSTPLSDSNGIQNSYPYQFARAGFLPQGAPTSGALANASTVQLDDALSDMALANHLVYTRYSDDMTFSSPGRLNRDHAREVITQIRKIVTASGLKLHAQKTKIVPPGARKIVLGMLVTEHGVGILPEQRRMIDLYIHAVSKYGLVEYADRRKFDSVLSFINHVEGWLAYLSHIDQYWAETRREGWNSALLEQDIFVKSLG